MRQQRSCEFGTGVTKISGVDDSGGTTTHQEHQTYPQSERRQPGGRTPQTLIAETYGQLITLPSAVRSSGGFFRGLLGEDPTPALFHCTTGKERTGYAAASFLTLMGVSHDVYRDYLLTNEQLLPALRPIVDRFAAAGGDPLVLLAVVGVDRLYLDRAFEAVREHHSTLERYFAEGLGIDEREQQTPRDAFVS